MTSRFPGGSLDNRGFSMLIGAKIPWQFWRKRKRVPSSKPSATPSRGSEEPNRWLVGDARLDLNEYGVRLDTPVVAEA